MRSEPDDELNALSGAVIGAAVEVHTVLGPGFLESTYEAAMCVELRLRSIDFVRQRPIDLRYKGVSVGRGRADLVVGDRVVVELKATSRLLAIHKAQVIAYLKALQIPLGLLLNFNVPLLRDGIERIVLTE